MYDLGVGVAGNFAQALAAARQLGYHGVALTVRAAAAAPNALDALRPVQLDLELALPASAPFVDDALAARLRRGEKFAVFSRLHVTLASQNDLFALRNFLRKHPARFDIVSASVTEQSVLNTLIGWDVSLIDVLSLPVCEDAPPLRLKRSQVARLTALGAFFEVDLGPVLDSTEMLAPLSKNLRNMVRYVPPARLLVTNGCAAVPNWRAPRDLVALLDACGALKRREQLEVLLVNPGRAVQKALRRQHNSGAVPL